MTVSIDPVREAACDWIAATITKHLHPDLHPCGGPDRVRRVAQEVEATSFESGVAVEVAIQLAIEWCDQQN